MASNNSKVFDEMLKMAAKEHIEKEIAEYNTITENDRHIFSTEFETKMSKILNRGKKPKNEQRNDSTKKPQMIGKTIHRGPK